MITWKKMRRGPEMTRLWISFCLSLKTIIAQLYYLETNLTRKLRKRKPATKTYSKLRTYLILTAFKVKLPWNKTTSTAHCTRTVASLRKTSAKLSKTPNSKAKFISIPGPSKPINKTKTIINPAILQVVSTLLVKSRWTQSSPRKRVKTPTPKGPSLSLN